MMNGLILFFGVILALPAFSQDTSQSFYSNGQAKYLRIENKDGSGVHIEWYESGQRESLCRFRKNKNPVMCRRWHTNGQLSFRQKLSGKWMTWDEKGRKEMVIYDGRRKGFSKHFDTTGRLVSYGYYKKLGWGATEYHNGKKILLVRYKKGSPITGSCIENENPDDARYQHRICVYMVGGTEVKIKHDSTISDLEGKIIKNHFKGKTKKCYPNGQRQGVCYYKKGKVNGWLREWDENGKLIRKKLFRAGKCVKTVKDYEGPYFISKTEQPGLINE